MSETDNVQDVNNTEEKKPNETVEEEEDEAQKMMKMMASVASMVLKFCTSCVKCVSGILKCLLGCVRSAMGAAFGLVVFMLFAYILRHFILEEVTEEDVPDFESKLKFLLRCEIWPVLPVFWAAALATMSKNDVHARFAKDRFEQALTFLLNILLLSTHIETECLAWVRACALVNAFFSTVLWFSMANAKKPWTMFSRAVNHHNLLALACNVHAIVGQELGLPNLFVPAEVSVETQTESSSGWF